MPRRLPRAFKITALLRDAETWPTNVVWPAPIDARLSELVELAIGAGDSAALSRSELLGALVLAAPTDPKKLLSLIQGYRKARVAHAVTDKARVSKGLLTLGGRRPGRRSSRNDS